MEDETGTSYLEALARQWQLVLACTLLGLVGVYLYSSRADDVFAASSELLLSSVSSAADPFGDAAQVTGDGKRALNNAVSQLGSESIRKEVKAALDDDPLEGGVSLDDIDEAGEDASTAVGGRAALLGSVAIRSGDDSDAIRVVVESIDATVARDAANLYVAAFRRRRSEQERGQLTLTRNSLTTQINDMEPKIKALDQQITSEGRRANPNLALVNTLTDQVQLFRTQVSEFQQQVQSIDFQLANLTGGVEVLSTAGRPSSPVRPTPLRDGLLGAIGGFVLGGGIAFLRSENDRTLRSATRTETVSGLPVLGVVPFLRELPFAQPRVVSLDQPGSLFAEAFAATRSSLQILQIEQEVRTILVTSTVSGEGKSTVVANLAVAMARSGSRVTVVGADLRAPTIHTFFRRLNEPGLSDVVVSGVPLAQAISEIEVPGGTPIRFLPAGVEPPNPAELLATRYVGDVLARLAAGCDVVLLDAAPVTPVTDATALSRWADITLVVCAEGITEEQHLATTLSRLRGTRANVAGIVYNRSRQTNRQSYYHRNRRRFGLAPRPQRR